MLLNIDHIQFIVTNLEESRHFFCDLLGFKVVVEEHLEGEWLSNLVGIPNVSATVNMLELPGCKTHLHIVEYMTPKSEPNPDIAKRNLAGLRHLGFEVEQIEDIVANMKKEGIHFKSEVQHYPILGKKAIYFEGPDGITLELYEYLPGTEHKG